MVDSWCFGAIYCCCRSLVATFMMLSLGARCCCNCRSLAVLAMLSLGNLVLASAVGCRSLAVVVLFSTAAAAAAVHLLSLSW
ncbi:hypothetical protein MAM1_0042c02969 [Mucor ambiguus]|uniref:Uncharacterized protein n=1 Tax=Mucor ambiguus TaxID=91626 RepID=A0A0C9M8M1_9FUNG|nr:hypothetical protein MAM1_0042c02969 [Mucor ambiguus]